MVGKWSAMLTTTAALCLCSGARAAANPAPDNTAAFIAYCPSHFHDCKGKVIEADIAAMGAALWATPPTQACAIPKGIDNDLATKEILAWLGEHRDVAPATTDTSIRAAMKSLWGAVSPTATCLQAGAGNPNPTFL